MERFYPEGEMTITRLREGGYVVSRRGINGFIGEHLLATGEIDAALKFVKDRIDKLEGQRE